jgi:hypothetical protein
MKRALLFHLAMAVVLLVVSAVGWHYVRSEEAGLTAELAKLRHGRDLARERAEVSRKQLELTRELAKLQGLEDRETTRALLQVFELHRAEERRVALEFAPQEERLRRGEELRNIQRLIACFPPSIRARVPKLTKPCNCAPGDPLCSCL